jgi:hypothetical protein
MFHGGFLLSHKTVCAIIRQNTIYFAELQIRAQTRYILGIFYERRIIFIDEDTNGEHLLIENSKRKRRYFNPNHHCIIALIKATACG